MMDVALSNTSEAKGKFKKCLFRGDNHYRICLFELLDWDDTTPISVQNKGEFVALGNRLPELDVFNVRLSGRWHRNEKRGGEMQFKVSSFSEETPTSREGIIKVLSCGIYKGIGEKTAVRIYDRFGSDSLRIINEETGRLSEIKGIGAVSMANLIESVRDTVELRKLAELLAVYDITPNMMRRIQKAFPENAYDLIKEEPFRLCAISGFGFKTSDDIAAKLGTPLGSPLRIQAAIEEVLKANNIKGNLYEFLAVIIKNTMELLNNRPSEEVTEEAVEVELQVMEMESRVAFDEDLNGKEIIYRHEDYLNETHAAKRMIELLIKRVNPKLTLSAEQMSERIAEAEKEFGMTFAPKQKEAIEAALGNKICVITGGPGTGKTTILRAFLSIYKRIAEENFDPDERPTPLLLSPTGKAARRMAESAREDAFTIHKGLGLTRDDSYSHDSMLTGEVGIVFIDEVSMADMQIWAKVVQALPGSTQLVAIGDVDQLPSVKAGAVLRDMIDSGVIPVVRLDVIYRQGEESLIVANSHKIRKGKANLSFSGSEFAFFPFPSKEENPESDNEVQGKIIKLYLRAIKKYGMQETLILCPRRENVTVSAYVINEQIQALLHGKDPSAQKFNAGGRVFYVGDRIIHTAKSDKAANGDMGTIVSAIPDPDHEGAWIALIQYDFMESGEAAQCNSDEFDKIQLGYSISIHKSQGSEAKCVFIPILQSQIHMLKRNLLYTGVTRAKEFVGILGQRKAFDMAIHVQDTTRRKTMLAARLRDEFEETL